MRCREGGKWRGFPFDIMLFLCKVRSSDERRVDQKLQESGKVGKHCYRKEEPQLTHTHTKDDRLAVTGVSLSCLW